MPNAGEASYPEQASKSFPISLSSGNILTREQEPEPEAIEPVIDNPAAGQNKRAQSPDVDEIQAGTNGVASKRARFLINKQGAAEDTTANGNYKKAYVEDGVEDLRQNLAQEGPEEYPRKRTRSGDAIDDAHVDKRAHTGKLHSRTPPSSFGLFSDDEATEDDEQTERVKEWERQRASKVGSSGAAVSSLPVAHPETPFLKLSLTMYSRRRQRSHH